MQTRRHSLGLAAMVVAAAVSCSGLLATKIADILANPREYDGRDVTVVGEVKETTNLLVARFFTVSDGSGEIVVVTERPLPRKGERVTVKGTVHEAFSLGERRVIVIQERRPVR